MSDTIKQAVLQQLAKVKGPDLEGDLVSLGLVSDVFVSDGRVAFSITVPADRAQELEPLRQAAEKVVREVPGVESAMVALTAERSAGSKSATPPPVRPAPSKAQIGNVPPPMQGRTGAAPEQATSKPGVPGVKTIIAVASGKGGVGKSTTTANLALGLQANGLKVGVLDADIYGPSVPRLFQVAGRPEPVSGRILKPLEGYGVKVMSMGFLVEEDTPMIWRGPMVISALTQMLREVAWGELDVLVVDMPPGTGDAQLTMAQQVPLAGAVIVSTPQDLALIDARKGLNMFRRVDVPVLGIVENMSYFLCPDCGGRHDIFGHGGARAEAEKLGVPFLGEVPLDMQIRETSDAGTPVVVSDPDGQHAKIYRDIAEKVMAEIARFEGEGQRAAPKIVYE
ncbi:iron-sulfur cluster carrier protein ApbC [Roseibium sediminis]|uniref:iron-sulfur cluster carrier protein ApbC n=1 Tax=Roseibium sediminis TaxID=1775174 RepID=UPI00123D16A3|nr:iron-sulfur cluster carrier protein ApbC [Roseibium sediminis]